MADGIITPHDRFAKVSLQDITIARAFLKAHLAPVLKQRIDFSSMRLTNNEFVLSHLKQIQSDVVYECLIDGNQSYLYFLLEHQSTPDELMAFRKLQYNIALMDQHIKKGNKKLPIIVSLCLYNGSTSPYPHSTDVFTCFENPALAQEMMFKPFKLVDLSVMNDQEIAQHGLAALFEMLLKHHNTKALFNVFKYLVDSDLFSTTIDQVNNGNYVSDLLEYALNTGEERKHQVEEIITLLSDASPEYKDQIMTVADQLRQQGRHEGVILGEKKGIEKGIEKVARNMLADKEPIEKIMRATDLTEIQLQAIKAKLTIH